MSACQSSGGKYQSQKMSIGMFAEEVVKPCVGFVKEADVSIKRKEKEASKTAHLIQRRVKASISSTMCNNDFDEDSAKVITGSKPGDSCLRGEQPRQALSGSGVGKKEAERISEMESRKVFMQPSESGHVRKEALRIKLREILGTVSSSDKIRTHEVKAQASSREQTLKEDDENFKTRQSPADTIEADSSENVDLTTKKPVTRSLARKRALARSRPKNLKAKQGSDIFSFTEKSAPSPACTANYNSLMAEKNEIAKKSCGAEPRGKVSPVSDPRSIQLEKISREKAQTVEELPMTGGVASPNHDCLDKNQPEASTHNLNLRHSPVDAEINKFPNLVPQKKYENFEPFGGHSPVNYVDDLNCQWRKMTKVKSGSPMGWDLSTDNNKKQPVQLERGVVHEAQCLFKSNTTSEKEISEFSDDACDLEYSQTSNSTSCKEENDAGNGLFIPVRGELEEISISKKVRQEVKDACTYPEISSLGKDMLIQRKRNHYHGVDLNDPSPTLYAPKASENANDVSMCFDDIPENGLARVASVLGVALEKIKSKMLLARNKKCSEIMVSAAEEIQLQLCSVQSQIQSDIEKLSSLKSSKRKRSEARLQEQQGHMKVMHEKFKEEISKYIQDCKGAMEGLESQHTELQGVIEKQKALHKKLLLQTEAAVETRLLDAHKQMMFVHKLEKQKMQMLKLTIAQCLKDTVDQ